MDRTLQVQDAFSTPFVVSNTTLGASEFEALNDVGYNRAAPPGVPEASTTVSFGLLGLGGVVLARKRNAVRVTA